MAELRLPSDAPLGPILVHTDAVRTHSLVSGVKGRENLISAHMHVLEGIADERALWFPTFNYGFLRSGTYNVRSDPSEVGTLSEHGRVSSRWRTTMPVFNFAGQGDAPVELQSELRRPFDDASAFGRCVADDGIVLWYGAPISTGTILHHAETSSGGPVYRYDKEFAGLVVTDEGSQPAILEYHVRPLVRDMDYDWTTIVADLESNGILRELDAGASVYWASAADLVGYWVERIRQDPLYLLDADSRSWVADDLDRLGRRFEITDFEQRLS